MNAFRSVLKWFNGLVKPSKPFNRTENKPILDMLNDEEILTEDEDDDTTHWRAGADKRSHSQNIASPPNSPPFKRIALNMKPLAELSIEKFEKKVEEPEEPEEPGSEPAESVDQPSQADGSYDDDETLTHEVNCDCISVLAKDIIFEIIEQMVEDDDEAEVEEEQQPDMIEMNNEDELDYEPIQLKDNLSDDSEEDSDEIEGNIEEKS